LLDGLEAAMTLDAFLRDNRAEIIKRTRAKVAARSSPPANATELEEGVPLFLSQLSATLEEPGMGVDGQPTGPSRASRPPIGETAAKHGRDLLRFGFTIDQVVHDYGDVCQVVTELAEERSATLSVAEFRTLNRCLDNAIAGAVTAWSDERDRAHADQTNKASKVTDTLMRDLGRLVERANASVDVIREGRIGIGGATGDLLRHALLEMRVLLEKAGAK
jgi:hypothetical protein